MTVALREIPMTQCTRTFPPASSASWIKRHAMGKWMSRFSNSESSTGIQRWWVSSGSAGYSGHTERTCVIPRTDFCEEDNATCRLRRRVRVAQDEGGERRWKIPSDVESAVDDRVNVVFWGDGHVFERGISGRGWKEGECEYEKQKEQQLRL